MRSASDITTIGDDESSDNIMIRYRDDIGIMTHTRINRSLWNVACDGAAGHWPAGKESDSTDKGHRNPQPTFVSIMQVM